MQYSQKSSIAQNARLARGDCGILYEDAAPLKHANKEQNASRMLELVRSDRQWYLRNLAQKSTT
jgi:hypothetical protein